jgi:hypothetical protein
MPERNVSLVAGNQFLPAPSIIFAGLDVAGIYRVSGREEVKVPPCSDQFVYIAGFQDLQLYPNGFRVR